MYREYLRSGKTVKEWCEENGIDRTTFHNRLRQIREAAFGALLGELLGSISTVGGSNLAKAVNYSLNNRKELETFLLDGRLELTNNRAERAVKTFVMGRKN